jgi:uncharacterized membrane protein YkvA (DUF1232 family)
VKVRRQLVLDPTRNKLRQRCDDEPMWWRLLIAAVAGVVLVWAILVVLLWRSKPDAGRLHEAIRLLPDVVRLLARLARDRSLPLGVRVRLWSLLAYLAMPFDLIPDFIPVIGYADDAIIVAATLRSVLRRTRPEVLARHWPGTPEGLAAVSRLVGRSAA